MIKFHCRALFLQYCTIIGHAMHVLIDVGWKRESLKYMKGLESLSLLSLFKGIKLSRKRTVPSAKAQHYVILFSFLLFSVLIAAFKCNGFKNSKIQDSRIRRSVNSKLWKFKDPWMLRINIFCGLEIKKSEWQSQISKRMHGFVNKNIDVAREYEEKNSRI